MDTWIILIDFDNISGINSLGRNFTFNDVKRRICEITDSLISTGCNCATPPDEIKFRLYSGWHNYVNNSQTELFFYICKSIRHLRRRTSKCRFLYDVATSLAASPDIHFENTFRVKKGVPNFKLDDKFVCHHTPCKLETAFRSIKKKCPDEQCPATVNNTFYYIEQKIVDTLIVCDAIYYSFQEKYKVVGIASDDDDMLPGLIYSSLSKTNVASFRCRNNTIYDGILDSQQISYNTLPLFSWRK
jgi:uncharacterized LabA/DUF88 family protein